jgi:hypothetical protein
MANATPAAERAAWHEYLLQICALQNNAYLLPHMQKDAGAAMERLLGRYVLRSTQCALRPKERPQR